MLLTEDELSAAREALPGWTFHASRIERSFRFADFSEAFGFMTRVALAAEKADHHPDWSNAWNCVDVALSTHSAGGLTALDIDMARTMDRLACPPA